MKKERKAFPLRLETFPARERFQTCFHQAAIFNGKERGNDVLWTGASVLLNHERRLRGL